MIHNTGSATVTAIARQYTRQKHSDGLQLYSTQRDRSAAHKEQREASAAHSYKEQHNNNDGKQ